MGLLQSDYEEPKDINIVKKENLYDNIEIDKEMLDKREGSRVVLETWYRCNTNKEQVDRYSSVIPSYAMSYGKYSHF